MRPRFWRRRRTLIVVVLSYAALAAGASGLALVAIYTLLLTTSHIVHRIP